MTINDHIIVGQSSPMGNAKTGSCRSGFDAMMNPLIMIIVILNGVRIPFLSEIRIAIPKW